MKLPHCAQHGVSTVSQNFKETGAGSHRPEVLKVHYSPRVAGISLRNS